MRFNIGIIGAGEIAEKVHIPSFSSHPDCKIIAICSKNAISANTLAKKYNIPFVEKSYKSLLERNDIDTISICTPTNTHKDIIEYAIMNNKNILCEKPLCTTYKDTVYILKKIKKYEKNFMVMFNNRYREENQWLKEQIEKEVIGKIEFIDIEWLRNKREINKDWLFRKEESGGGVLIDLGIHLIDLLLYLVKNRKKFKVFALSKFLNPYKESNVEDLVVSIVQLDDIFISFKTCWSLAINTPSKVNIKIYGDKGEISNLDYNKKTILNPYKLLIDDFINSIKEKRRIDLSLYRDAMQLVDAMYDSIKKNKIISDTFKKD